jgi:hypothetical protein
MWRGYASQIGRTAVDAVTGVEHAVRTEDSCGMRRAPASVRHWTSRNSWTCRSAYRRSCVCIHDGSPELCRRVEAPRCEGVLLVSPCSVRTGSALCPPQRTGTAVDRLLAKAARSAENQVQCPTVRVVCPRITFLLASVHRFEGLVGSSPVMDVPSWRGWLISCGSSFTQYAAVESLPDIQEDLLVLGLFR